MKRFFNYQNGKKETFWNIEVTGDTYTITTGKVGTDGKADSKTFETPDKCMKEAYKKAYQKYLADGYEEINVPEFRPNDGAKKGVKSAIWRDTDAVEFILKAIVEHCNPTGHIAEDLEAFIANAELLEISLFVNNFYIQQRRTAHNAFGMSIYLKTLNYVTPTNTAINSNMLFCTPAFIDALSVYLNERNMSEWLG